ncbi:MAG: hypothetical protein N2690_09945, partial [Rhodocyclaceae bacterium]|nr:hypothetical protein [Rhodocyclaceae bacterium]
RSSAASDVYKRQQEEAPVAAAARQEIALPAGEEHQAAPPPARNDPLKHLAGRELAAMPVRPLNARAQCRFRDPTGYRGELLLEVKASDVRRFEAKIDIPRRGRCHFRLADFRQTESAPAVVLAARQGECTVRLWKQGEQVTVAFRDCHAACSGEAIDYLWPILVDIPKGRCS